MEDLEITIVDDVLVIGVNLSRATLDTADAFRKKVEELINLEYTNYIIDLNQCEFIDSTFFGAIIVLYKIIKGKGYRLKVVEPGNIGEDIFTTRNFRNLFDLFKTREEAIKNFEGSNEHKS